MRGFRTGARETGHVSLTHLTLDLPVPLGGRVRTAWTAGAGAARGWAWVQHGFARGASALEGVADLLAHAGFVVVRPDIAWWRPRRSMHDPVWLTAASVTIARAAEGGLLRDRGLGADAPPRWALVGHSAGGAVVGHAAACLQERSPDAVATLVLLDPVDTVGGLLAGALPALEAGGGSGESLRDRSSVHACRPSRCNRHGATVAQLRSRGWGILEHPALSHADPERIPSNLAGPALPPDRWAVRVCGAPGSGPDVMALGEAVRAGVVSASAD